MCLVLDLENKESVDTNHCRQRLVTLLVSSLNREIVLLCESIPNVRNFESYCRERTLNVFVYLGSLLPT